jgi:cephalosporin-C deacetylase-like acetyl esterase
LQWAGEWAITFDVNAHGYELGRDQEYYNEFFSDKPRYAFDIEENKNPETAYFMGMAYRVMRALEYVKSLPEWNGKDLVVTGGSQGGLQTVWAAALDHDVTRAEASIPWCCDFAGPEKFGRINGWRPKYVRGLDYFDCINMAKRIPETCYFKVPRAGLGDYTCPPSGIAILFNNVKGPKEIKWVQGSTHGYTPPQPNQEWVFTENVKE